MKEKTDNSVGVYWNAEQVKTYLEAIMSEKQVAITLAENEREKAAAALRDQLTERITSGDANLREHISTQIGQLKLIVENVEVLSLARQEAMQREMKIQHEADKQAIAKSEASFEVRFAAANEWRGQSADRERTQQEQIASFVATLTPLVKSEAIEDKLAALIDRNSSDIAALTNRFDVKQGETSGVKLTTSVIVTVVTIFIGVIGTIVLLANYFTA